MKVELNSAVVEALPPELKAAVFEAMGLAWMADKIRSGMDFSVQNDGREICISRKIILGEADVTVAVYMEASTDLSFEDSLITTVDGLYDAALTQKDWIRLNDIQRELVEEARKRFRG